MVAVGTVVAMVAVVAVAAAAVAVVVAVAAVELMMVGNCGTVLPVALLLVMLASG